MQYDVNPIFLYSMATIQYVLFPFLSLGSSTARLNPKLSTSPIARKINLVGQTKLNSKRLAKINQSYIKEFREDSNIDHR